MADKNKDVKIAVIGAGALGLVTIKNLLEVGFDVTGFESRSYVGGLWKSILDNTTCALPTTIINISKERGCFTDFPFPDEIPSLCSADDVQAYLERYTDHFGLRRHIRFSTTVQRVTRDDTHDKWLVEYTSTEGWSKTQTFDKVAIATGPHETPYLPKIAGLDTFAGTVLHSQRFKRPEDFADKTVVVVGIGNTAADTATALVGRAKKIYLSHRSGVAILPRRHKGLPIGQTYTYRLLSIQNFVERVAPDFGPKLFDWAIANTTKDAFPSIYDPKNAGWRILPAPSVASTVPTVTDELIPALERGDIESVPGIKAFVGPSSIELEGEEENADPRRLDDIDAIIFCTGYTGDLGMATLLEPRLSPTRNTTPEWLAAPGSRGKPLPRLYRNIFSLDHPQSLAFLGAAIFATAAFLLYDQATMALAQIWAGNSKLPSRQEMERDVDAHHARMVALARAHPSVSPSMVRQGEWLAWAEDAAGTGVAAHLDWTSWRAWWFWLRQPRLASLLAGGLYSPHLYRFFDGPTTKRKPWPGAKAAIEKVNRKLAEQKTKLKQA